MDLTGTRRTLLVTAAGALLTAWVARRGRAGAATSRPTGRATTAAKGPRTPGGPHIVELAEERLGPARDLAG